MVYAKYTEGGFGSPSAAFGAGIATMFGPEGSGIYNNNVELVWTDAGGRHTEVLPRETDGASTLRTYLDKEGVQINSYKELMPRMNDIFIKLVTEGEE